MKPYGYLKSSRIPIVRPPGRYSRIPLYKSFYPLINVRPSLKNLRKLTQSGSFPKYLSEFHNICLTIPDMNDGEQSDKLFSDIESEIFVEVLKAGAKSLE